MDGLSHYLQTSTQGAMIVPTQPTNDKLTKQNTQQQEKDCVVPQYFSNSMSVLPADRNLGGSYYIIYHRDVSGDCRDDETSSLNDGIRRYCGGERDGSFECTTTKKSVKFVTTNDRQNFMYDTNTGSRSRRRSEQISPTSFLEDLDHDDDSGFASHAAAACVACSIPVLHFLQFFMC